jgi:hypothetical protein
MEEAENAFQHGADYLWYWHNVPYADKTRRCTDKSRHEINNRDRRHPSNPRIHCCSIPQTCNEFSIKPPHRHPHAKLSDIAIVSAIVASPDPQSAARELRKRIDSANTTPGPIIFDPVGGGATSVRRAATKQLLAGGFFDCIKGNEGELKTVSDPSPGPSSGGEQQQQQQQQQRGVDSGPSTTIPSQKAALVKSLAQRERCIVLPTGAVDYLSDGTSTLVI